MPIDPAYQQFADFLVNNPDRMAQLEAATAQAQAVTRGQNIANQQNQLVLAQQARALALRNAVNQGMIQYQSARPTANSPVPSSPAPPPPSNVSPSLPTALAPKAAAPAPAGSMRTPEGLVVSPGTPAMNAAPDTIPNTGTDSVNNGLGGYAPAAGQEAAQPIASAAAPIIPVASDSSAGATDTNSSVPDSGAASLPDTSGIEQAQPIASAAPTVTPDSGAAAPAYSVYGTGPANTTTAPATYAQMEAQRQQDQQMRDVLDRANGHNAGHLGYVANYLARQGFTPLEIQDYVMNQEAVYSKHQADLARNSTEYNKAMAENHARAYDAINSWMTDGTHSLQQRAQEWPKVLQDQVKKGNIQQAEADQYPQYPGDDAAHGVLNYLLYNKEAAESQESMSKAQTAKQTADYWLSAEAQAKRKGESQDAASKGAMADAQLKQYTDPTAVAARKANDEKAITEAQVATDEAKVKRAIALDTLANQNHWTPEQVKQNSQFYAKLDRETEATDFSDAAIDRLADLYHVTGVMPGGLGLGKSAGIVKKKIADREADKYEGTNLADNRTLFDSYKASAKQLEGSLNMMQNYENTAGKNLDVFLSQAKKAIDTGSPWINTPVRNISLKGLGSDDLAAVNTARVVARSEIARVVNSSPTGTGGGPLTDAQKKEIHDIMPDDANLKQMYEAAKILRQDMKNRIDSINDQIGEVHGKIKRMSATSAPAPAMNPGAGGTGNSDMINVQIPGQAPGQIHASQWDSFKNLHKDAVKLQPQ